MSDEKELHWVPKYGKYLCPKCGKASATTEFCEDCQSTHCAFCAGNRCFEDNTPAGEGEE